MKDLLMKSILFDQVVLWVLGFIMSLLVIAFTAWAGVVWKGLKTIGDKFDALREDMNIKSDALRKEMLEHLLDTERRLTLLEAAVSASKVEKSDGDATIKPYSLKT